MSKILLERRTWLVAMCILAGSCGLGEFSQAEVITNSLGMKFTLIPAGEFSMGAEEMLARYHVPSDFYQTQEWPVHHVRITQPFWLGTHEVTKGQFARFAQATGYRTEAETEGKGSLGYVAASKNATEKPEFNWRNTGFPQSDDHPVVNVTWKDAVAFCQWLSKQEGKTYRLPTEAEWEYACRAGTDTRYWTGDASGSLQGAGNFGDQASRKAFPQVDARFFFDFDDGWPFTAPVGRFRPNAFGLYDMHGNVWEWCSDRYEAEYYANSPASDPRGPATGEYRVRRGGSWGVTDIGNRSAHRSWNMPASRHYDQGFRVARDPSKE